MAWNEKAPAAAATTTEARDTTLLGGNYAPAHNCSIRAGAGQEPKICIYDLLPTGEENAVPRRQLAAVTSLSDRCLRRQIAVERRAGALILSSTERGGGYYRPGSTAELRRFVASMTSRGRETFAALTAARRALDKAREIERAADALEGVTSYGE